MQFNIHIDNWVLFYKWNILLPILNCLVFDWLYLAIKKTLAPKPKSYWLARFHHWMKKTKYMWLSTCEFSIAIGIKYNLVCLILPNIHASFKGPLEDSKHELSIWNRVNVSARNCTVGVQLGTTVCFLQPCENQWDVTIHTVLCLPVVSALNDVECFLTLCAFQRSFIPFPSIIL